MEAAEQRANRVDRKLKDLTTTVGQLQSSMKGKQGGNTSNASDGPGLCRSDALKLIAQLKSIRAKVVRYEEERAKEKQYLQTVREQMRTELLELKKALMADQLRQTPEEFRKYLETQLNAVKQELLRAEATSKQSTMVGGADVNVLNKVKRELIAIRGEMAVKLEELKAHQQFEREMDGFKKKLTAKLMKLKSEVSNHEEELQRLRAENEEFRYFVRWTLSPQNNKSNKCSVATHCPFTVH